MMCNARSEATGSKCRVVCVDVAAHLDRCRYRNGVHELHVERAAERKPRRICGAQLARGIAALALPPKVVRRQPHALDCRLGHLQQRNLLVQRQVREPANQAPHPQPPVSDPRVSSRAHPQSSSVHCSKQAALTAHPSALLRTASHHATTVDLPRRWLRRPSTGPQPPRASGSSERAVSAQPPEPAIDPDTQGGVLRYATRTDEPSVPSVASRNFAPAASRRGVPLPDSALLSFNCTRTGAPAASRRRAAAGSLVPAG